MKVVLFAGVLLLNLAMLFVGMAIPDTFEIWAISSIEAKAEEMKRTLILESVEYSELDAENQRLHEEFRLCQASTGWSRVDRLQDPFGETPY